MSTVPATILIVDDEYQNRKLLETLLRPEGYSTVTAASGEDALAAIALDAPDLILLDIMMPDMDGYELARILKASPATSNIPIIMVTALVDRSARMEGLEAGAEEFLTKPVDRAELWLRVRNLLRLKAFGDLVQNQSAILEHEVGTRTAELRESEARFSAFMESSPVLAWVRDSDGHVLYSNKSWNGVFEIDPADGTPRPQGGARSEEVIEKATTSDLDSSPGSGSEVCQSHLRISEPGGALRYLNIVQFPIQEASGRTVWGSIAVDVTSQKLAELEILDLNAHLEQRVAERTVELEAARNEANVANQAKSSFLATMSHEIRTPMNGIVGMVDVLAHGRLSEHQGDAVRIIRESAFTLLQLLEDLLDFSKIEAGRLDMERMPVTLADLAEGVCDTLSPVADSKNVDLFLRISPAGPAQVWSDPVRLRQILYNLVGNAIKFSGGRTKRGRVEVVVENACEAPLRVRFRIADDGIGMSQATQRHLFESFRQAEVSTTRRFGGTGLGLAICKRLVELMGGDIHVESTQWLGSSFTVELPLDPVEGAVAAPLPDLSGLDFVLVASPNLDVENARAYLERAGARTHLVDSAANALDLCARMPAPVVVVHGAADDTERDAWLSGFANLPKVRHLSISRGRRRVARLTGSNVVVIDGNSMRRRSLLHAAAVAAGRASPETGYQSDFPDLAMPPIAAPTVDEARAEGRLILIAEDDSTNQKVLLRQLELLGYAAEVASDGLEALHLWRGGGHALLLTDLHMPGMDGYGLTTAIRREESGLRHMPILALTANAMHGEASRARAAGLDEYLAKPIQLSVLREVLDKWLPFERNTVPAEEPYITPIKDARPLLDIAVLRTIVGNSPSTLREVLSDYGKSAGNALVALNTAMAEDDLGAVGNIAHRLKSASRTVGAAPLGDLCDELETACRRGERSQVEQTMAELIPAFVELLENVKRCQGTTL